MCLMRIVEYTRKQHDKGSAITLNRENEARVMFFTSSVKCQFLEYKSYFQMQCTITCDPVNTVQDDM